MARRSARPDETQLRELPGIGKDLAKKVRELVDTGACQYHQELLQEFPPSVLDLLRLQGVGPKTVALLYAALNIRTLDDLEAAARDGRLRGLRGMQKRLILRRSNSGSRDAGRHLLSDTTADGRRGRRWLEAAPGVASLLSQPQSWSDIAATSTSWDRPDPS